MSEHRRKPPLDGTGTLIFGMIFTVVGGGTLIQRVTGFDVWHYLWRLWPLLLIVMGAKILVDYYSYRSTSPKEEQ